MIAFLLNDSFPVLAGTSLTFVTRGLKETTPQRTVKEEDSSRRTGKTEAQVKETPG